MLFKFLTGKEIGPLQTGLILSQVGGLFMIFMALMVLLPSRIFTFDINETAMLVFLVLGIIRILAPIAACAIGAVCRCGVSAPIPMPGLGKGPPRPSPARKKF